MRFPKDCPTVSNSYLVIFNFHGEQEPGCSESAELMGNHSLSGKMMKAREENRQLRNLNKVLLVVAWAVTIMWITTEVRQIVKDYRPHALILRIL